MIFHLDRYLDEHQRPLEAAIRLVRTTAFSFDNVEYNLLGHFFTCDNFLKFN